jgi:hypothetical protein
MERILKEAREKPQSHKPIRITSDFSSETLKARGYGLMYLRP